MNDKKYLVFMTPKAASKFDPSNIPKDYSNFEIVATPGIYINLLDAGWDEKRCDNIVYIVEKPKDQQ